jgi:DNA primase
MSFFSDYFGTVQGARESAVCCPFEHYTQNGIPYKETNPSASVNDQTHLFHCMVCGNGSSEPSFIAKLFGCSYLQAKKLQRCFNNNEDLDTWENEVNLTAASKEKIMSLGVSAKVVQELKLGTPEAQLDTIAFPVFMYGHIVDIRTYNPGHKPKVCSRSNSPAGVVIPFDIWRETPVNRMTIICAGEKDMANARSQGLNAITLTGGENTPTIMPEMFRKRKVAICYDNDQAGLKGAKKLALQLLPYAESVRIVTKFHEVCIDPGEDITDFFCKYKKTKQDLIAYIEATPVFVPTEEDLQKHYPIVDLLEASKPEHLGQMLQSNIQVVAVSEATFATPSAVIAEKYKMSGEKDTMQLGDFKEWELLDDNVQDILHLIDNNFKEDAINKNLKFMLKIPSAERNVSIKTVTKKTIFKCYVTDMFETTDTNAQPMEYVAYSVNQKLESGQKYLVTFKLVPHPYKGQQLTMLITDAVQANDSVSKFTVTDEVKANLDIIKNLNGSVSDRINLMTEKVKGLLGYNGNNTLIQIIDLCFNTVLQFNFNSFKNVRGYLDTIVVGESRVGKSSTADALRKLYGLGVFTSLAGNSATVPGLVGGSNKTTAGYQTRAGIIPQNHRGLIIFEEFGKSNSNVIKELTDIRSSNEVRITRVSGTITLPAMVRMVSLTNPKNVGGTIKPIAAYPNGIAVITELIETAEDIARYDVILILSDRGTSQIDPMWEPQQPFDEAVYRTRIRWIWSRKPEQILMSKEVMLHIVEQANALNKEYECHIKIFGTEAWKKLSRLAIAVAGYLVSTDDYETIKVEKEHVDYAVALFKRIYDNSTFKLKEYVAHEKKFTTIDEDGIANLQDLYTHNPALINQLEQCASATKNILGAGSGLSNDDLNKALNRLSQGLFVRFENHDIIPTERFRLGLSAINKATNVRRLGE